MNVITGRVKSETGKPIPQFCNTCFSVDRRLYHAGHLLDTLNNLFKHSTTELAFQPVSVCWECRAVLQRVRDFKMNVAAVQQFFCRHQYDQTLRLPPPLSRLSKVRANTEICIKHGVKLEREVQKGSPLVKDRSPLVKDQPEHATVEIEVDVKREVKADSDDGHWQNDEVESKQTSPKPALRDDWYRNTSKPSGSQIKQETPTRTPSKPVKTDSLKTDLNPAQINHWYKKQTKPKPSEYKYIRRIESNLCMEKFYTKFPVDSVQLDKLLEDDRKDKLFTALPHRCNRCICGWRIKKNLETHNKSRHSESAGPYQCDICTRRMLGKNRIRLHVKAHYVARKCNMCEYKTATQSSMRRHILKNHYKSVECRTCGAFFRSTRDFHYHYKTLHRRFVCDHCGRSCITRDAIEKHLVLHGPFLCCGRQFPSYRAMKDHRTHYHSSRGPPELSYCVECNKQFDSVARFKKHLATAVVHRDPNKPSRPSKKPAPCPDCGKVYARMHSMRDHYNFEHLGWSNYKCQVCDVYFRNRTIYKHHMLSRHEPGWKPPRDKICSECGRGFTSSEVLKKHIRTHTGERPYACTYCDAAFAQSTALKSHVRHIHLKERRTPASQLNNASS